ncbi:MAG TPA: hypothetical protein VGR45_06310 [Stellaceae bacterium]|nr:hypothetical protein [Stellaceae bacterium]
MADTHAIENAKSWYSSIKEMVEALEANDDGETDEARERIVESALSVQVRSGWYSPGALDADTKPAEYEILLTTGGPALRIIGELSSYGEPEDATLEWQDWGTPWTRVHMSDLPDNASEVDRLLLAFAGCFYFGE